MDMDGHHSTSSPLVLAAKQSHIIYFADVNKSLLDMNNGVDAGFILARTCSISSVAKRLGD